MNITIDPEFRDILPPLAPDELAKLEANIIRDGCREPLVLWQGLIVDGHNRYDICTRNKVGHQTNHLTTNDYPDRDSIMLWMLSNQGGRRNLSDIDRIALAAKREEVLARMAKARQATSTGGDKKSAEAKAAQSKETPGNQLPAKSPEADPTGKSPSGSGKTPGKTSAGETRSQAAKAAGVGEKKYEEGKVILEAAATGEIAPEVLEEVRAGKASIHKVSKEIKERRQAAKAAKAEAETPRPSERTGDLLKIELLLGDEFARSIEIGTLLKTPREYKAFMALSPEDQKEISTFVLMGWTVANSVKFIRRIIDENDRIAVLTHLCVKAKGPSVVVIGPFTITTAFTPTA